MYRLTDLVLLNREARILSATGCSGNSTPPVATLNIVKILMCNKYNIDQIKAIRTGDDSLPFFIVGLGS